MVRARGDPDPARRDPRPRAGARPFNVTFDELLEDEHIQQTALGQYNVNLWRQFEAEDPSTDNVWLLCRTIGGISLNWPRYCDEERDALLLQAQATTDHGRAGPRSTSRSSR